MAELTHIERYLAQEENNVELRIVGRVSEVLLAQEDGTAKPHIELRLKAEVVTPHLATAFSDAHIRAMPYSGNHDRRPDGQIVQGFVRPFDRELEVAIAVPENAFLAFSLGSSSLSSNELQLTLWPFEVLDSWDRNSPLLLRQVRLLTVARALR